MLCCSQRCFHQRSLSNVRSESNNCQYLHEGKCKTRVHKSPVGNTSHIDEGCSHRVDLRARIDSYRNGSHTQSLLLLPPFDAREILIKTPELIFRPEFILRDLGDRIFQYLPKSTPFDEYTSMVDLIVNCLRSVTNSNMREQMLQSIVLYGPIFGEAGVKERLQFELAKHCASFHLNIQNWSSYERAGTWSRPRVVPGCTTVCQLVDI